MFARASARTPSKGLDRRAAGPIVGCLAFAFVVLAIPLVGRADSPEPVARTGIVAYEPAEDEAGIPQEFRLDSHEFPFQERPLDSVCSLIRISEVTFPSPVETPHPNNNTVHCECFRPVEAAAGSCPGVIVLHILGGDFELSRLFCRTLAHHGVTALFVKLPYYGPRRQPDAPEVRMIALDPRDTVAGMTQAVLDIRRARAWLAARDEVDPGQTGIFGISLGGITTSLAAAAEPRFTKVCPMLAGGDIAQVSWSAREVSPVRERWLAKGGTRESFFETVKLVDPVTHAANLRGRQMLMLNAAHDEVIPRACTESLWNACGQPEIVWYDAGHYTAARFIFDGLSRVTRFFQPDGPRQAVVEPLPSEVERE
jgi:dienelactone hydrolase